MEKTRLYRIGPNIYSDVIYDTDIDPRVIPYEEFQIVEKVKT